MSNDSKVQPTGWVVVDFEDEGMDGLGLPILDASDEWRRADDPDVSPFCCVRQIEWSGLPLEASDEVHPWPLPASVIARLKERHPTVDWSQVPVAEADAPVEKLGRWVIESLRPVTDHRYRDKADWHGTADRVSLPWKRLADVQGFMQRNYWSPLDYRVVNLDDLPAPAVAEPSEVEKLRARVGWLDMLDTEEGRRTFADEKLRVEFEELRGALIECVKACGGGATERVSTEFLLQTPGEVRLCVANLRAEVEHRTRERDEARAELSRCKQAHSAAEDDVESLREQLGKARLSRLDEFAKAALTGVLANPNNSLTRAEVAMSSRDIAQATIRAIDGAGGA